jgi:hypothetical protein
MRQIPREEYDANWEVERSGDQQNTQDISGTKWGRMGQPTDNVVMNGMQNVNTFTAEVTPMESRKNEGFDGGRSEETDREAYKKEILGSPVLDADFSGDPVAANEESVSTFDPNRAGSEADAEAAEAREEELSGQFQEFEAQDAQLNDDDGEETPDDPTASDGTEGGAAEVRAKKTSRKTTKK